MADDVRLGVMPVFKKGFADNASYVRELVGMLEEEGVESIWAVEHVIMAKNYEPRYPYSQSGRMSGARDVQMPDPLEFLSFVGGCTHRLRLATAVVVAPLHQPVVLAKRVATLDALTDGRVLFGVGSGWQKEEYEACGVPYVDRGLRLDEVIAAMRELWQPGYRSFKGRYVSFDNIDPTILPFRSGGPPIIIGGSSEVAARRAGRVGDGFFPYVIGPDDLDERVGTIRAEAERHGRDHRAIEIMAWPGSWQPGGSLDSELLRRYVDVGCSRLVVSVQESGSTDIAVIRNFLRSVRAALPTRR